MAPPDPEQRVEAARYAMLRRLAHSLRHHVASHLQPIGMMTETMQRRLSAGSPDLAQLRDGLAKVNSQARTAVASSLDVVAWLAPEASQLVALDAGVRDCVELLRGALSLRGFTLRSEVEALADEVPQAAVRSVVPAVLLAAADHGTAPADVVVSARRDGSKLFVVVNLRPGEGSTGLDSDPPYRRLEWSDVEAIAAAEGVGCTRDGASVTLAFAA